MNTYDLASKKVNLKKVASTHGGEWAGPCPACGGNDRFHVWPKTNAGKGSYWCRSCGKSGDNIQFLIDFEGMNFKQACEYLNIHISDDRPINRPPAEKPEFQPATHQNPAELWQEKAEKFVSWAQENLQQNKEAMDWLAARGIPAAAATDARLGWNPGEEGRDIFRSRSAWGLPEMKKENGRPRMLWLPQGLVIPYCPPTGLAQGAGCGVVQRIRIRRPDEILSRLRAENPDKDPSKYYIVPGSSMATMIIGVDRKAFVVIESELDGIACAAATEHAGAVALGTLEGKPDAAAYAILNESIQILNALDYGDEGGGKKAAERAFNWWMENFPERCDRWPVPKGKDPGEAFALGIDLKSWIEAGLPPVITMVKGEMGKVNSEKTVVPAKAGIQSDNVIPVKAEIQEIKPPETAPALLKELWKLLRDNPGVKIINTPERLTVLKNDRYVGGRINDLVMKPGEVNDYLLAHPDEEINYKNLFKGE